jgi:AraC-like DNA-binding protein
MLQNPAMSARTITSIALSCGFNSSAYFSTEFRRAYGMSPKRYRVAHLQTDRNLDPDGRKAPAAHTFSPY